MAPEQQKLAQELASEQRDISVAEFFEKNKQMLGFDNEARSLVTAVKEAVDNSLDATEEAGVLPDIYVEIKKSDDFYTLIVEDNGPGVTKSQIPNVFGKLLYGSRFHKREQKRGQQGIGISAAVMNAQLTSGNPTRITSKTENGNGKAQYYELFIDTDENEPVIQEEQEKEWDRAHGTRIEMDMAANMRNRNKLHSYIKHTAVVNPHARVEFREPGLKEPMEFERVVDELPDETEEIKPHPHGINHGTLRGMLQDTDSYSLSGFFQNEFTRVGQKSAEDILNNFRDRMYGRECAWMTEYVDRGEVVDAIKASVSNKREQEVIDFAGKIADMLFDRDAVARSEITGIVGEAAESVESGFGTRFGSTVRENAAEAVWWELTTTREQTLRSHVDAATSQRKTDSVIDGMAERLTAKFVDNAGGSKYENDRLTRSTLEDLVDRAADTTENVDDVTFGDTARENIVDEMWDDMQTVPDDVPTVRKMKDDRDGTAVLLDAMKATDLMAPPSDCLSPIGSEKIEAGLKKTFDAEFYAASTRDADVHGGDPFIAEAGIAYGGDLSKRDGTAEVMRFANRVPLVFQQGGCATTKTIKDIRWKTYNLTQPGDEGLPKGPVVILVHVASTNVPFTSEAKDAVSDVQAIRDEVEQAIRQAARELKEYTNKQQSRKKRREKQNVLTDILPDIAGKLSEMTESEPLNIEESMADIMNSIYVDREVNGETASVAVRNHSNSGSDDFELTAILPDNPGEVTGDGISADDLQVVEMDDEWYVKADANVGAGEEVSVSFKSNGFAADEIGISIDGVVKERIIIEDTDEEKAAA